MPQELIIQTERPILRQWLKEDLEPFAQLNADSRVREYFPGLLSRKESFDHPRLPKEHKLSWHVLYRLKLMELQGMS